MKFSTKLWHRSEKSFATTIPQALLFMIDPSKKYSVEWSYNSQLNKWFIDFSEKQTKDIMFKTSLWKRSQKSYATTIPHAVLLHIDEEKENKATWEFDSKIKKWSISIEVVSK